MAQRLAFLGMGGMGQSISQNLIQKAPLEGPLTVWNRTQSVAETAASQLGNARAASTPEEAVAGADIVWSCLSNEGAVQSVYEGILKSDIKGKLFIESSSIPSKYTNDLSEQIQAAGAEFIAMPVFGDPSLARKGMLTCLPAGPRSSVEKIKPFLVGVTAKAIVDLSDEEPGNASMLKLIGNTLIVNTMETVAEALVFSEKAGVGSKYMAQVVSTLFPLPPHSIYLQRMMGDEYYSGETMANLAMAKKLASNVIALAKASGASVPAYECGVSHIAKAAEELGDKGDITAIYGAVRAESGLPFKTEPKPKANGS